MKPRLMYISTLPCEQTTGGPVQMYRHFVENRDFDLDTIIESYTSATQYIKTSSKQFNRLLDRGSKTRFFPEFIAINTLLAEHQVSPLILDKVLAYAPNAIVTVAFGNYSFVASNVARKLKLPLITFFHDWWPDLTPCRGMGKKLLDKRFFQIYQQSDLALCVCESMRRELGTHRNSIVLYPIPNINPPKNLSTVTIQQTKQLKVVYLGWLGGDHGKIIQSLVDYFQIKSEDWLDLRVYGSTDGWNNATLDFAKSKGLYRGSPKHGFEVQTVLSEADAFLVVLNFSQSLRRRVKTSFPSKILEYSYYGKPIIVWGPDDSSAVRFLKDHEAGLTVTSPEPANLIQRLFKLKSDIDERVKFSRAAKKLSESIFDPSSIHTQMLSAINRVIDTFPSKLNK
ncbi:hypothetical protein VB711_22965 [Cronbergia sp. UHCC 0137]|uniref:hypothetical protein n=1 Tax=Cronbergia sp. UHCC 0137 TaxID=3110239 RepID=UPI002B1F3BED|nr:hypothetical protein [Cronbergia sp. UHCC 0137]MEA5620679.1 hypothetical protein [Cronbergia sp. UHCC 0137]